jgi:hypothetical protein
MMNITIYPGWPINFRADSFPSHTIICYNLLLALIEADSYTLKRKYSRFIFSVSVAYYIQYLELGLFTLK